MQVKLTMLFIWHSDIVCYCVVYAIVCYSVLCDTYLKPVGYILKLSFMLVVFQDVTIHQ